MNSARFIAFYLPQYYPIPENDLWWGKGFTEWVNVAKAKPLFPNHYQPHIPADLGFYDLRMTEVREQQVELAKRAGIEGFCYWHYWFGNGRQLLERPFKEVVETGKPDFPFCLCWANHSWSNKTWIKTGRYSTEKVFMQQEYPGDEDYTAHFYSLLPAFKDPRYILVDGCPLFVIYNPVDMPDTTHFISLWKKLAVQNGLKGMHIVGRTNNASFRKAGEQGVGKFVLPDTTHTSDFYNVIIDEGFDAVNSVGRLRAELLTKGKFNQLFVHSAARFLKIEPLNKCRQADINKILLAPEDRWENVYPTIFPNWDRSPRAGRSAVIYTDSTPQAFGDIVKRSIECVKDKAPEHRIVFIQAWNEWGEGNHMEPDQKYGTGYIDTMHKIING